MRILPALLLTMILLLSICTAYGKDIYKWKIIPSVPPYTHGEFMDYQRIIEEFRYHLLTAAIDSDGNKLSYLGFTHWYYDGMYGCYMVY